MSIPSDITAVEPAVCGVAIVAAALVAAVFEPAFNFQANMLKAFNMREPSFRYSL